MASTLIIVDLQKGFLTEHSRHIVAPVEAMQHHFDHVIFTRFYNPDGSPFRRILSYTKLPPGDEGTQLACSPKAGAVVLEKPHYSCCNHELLAYLEKWNAGEVYLAGIATEACVLKTALDLFEKNIRCRIITDLCASDDGAPFHDPALKLLKKLIGAPQLVTHAEALRNIQS